MENNMYDIGKRMGELHTMVSDTQKTVLDLDEKFDKHVLDDNKLINDHIMIDHVRDIRFMNWRATVKHYSPHALLIVIICLGYLFLPEPVLGLLIKIKSEIGGLM